MSLPKSIGRYQILGLLATGGMAEVLLAKLHGPAGFERAVVLKRVLTHFARQPEFRTMFLDEARVVAGLRHPNVVQVQELGEDGDELFIVMEYVEGETVASLLKRLGTLRDRMPFAVAAHIVAEACAGLHAAHELRDERGNPREIVHRDVSPQNVMVTYDGSVKVLDFGIARAADRSTTTDAGVMKGKLGYMSPEQCQQQRLDRRSDVFSLGILLYELSTGQRLFARDTHLAAIRAVCDEPIPSPASRVAGYSERLDAIVKRALARDRDGRYATAAEMRRDLVAAARALDPEGIPQEHLAAMMPSLFADRIEEKQEMLRRLSVGSALTHIPAPEVKSEPTAALAERGTSSAVVVEARGSPTRRPALTAVGVALLAVTVASVGAYLVLRAPASPVVGERAHVARPPPTTSPAAPQAPEAPLVTRAPPEHSRAARVRLQIETTPSGARVTLGTVVLGETPLDVHVARGLEPAELTIARDGYVEARERLVPDTDQRLRLTLARARRGAAPRTTGTSPGARPRPPSSPPQQPEQPPGYFRFD